MINMIHLLTGQVEYSKLVVFWSCKGKKGSEEKMKKSGEGEKGVLWLGRERGQEKGEGEEEEKW